MIIVTIVEYPSMPGRYRYSTQLNGKRKGHGDAGSDPGSAAATAVEIAIKYGPACAIVAPEAVMKLIPSSFK